MAFEVIIAGGGPVGLFLATELGLRGISVLVLEKAGNPYTPLKAGWMGMRGVNVPSLAAFHRRGLLDAMRDAALMWIEREEEVFSAEDDAPANPKPRSGGHFAGIPIDGSKVDPVHDPYAVQGPVAAISIEDLETLLAQRAEALGVVIRRGCAVTDLQQEQDGVTVHAGAEVFNAGWLVGCDGGRSVVRRQAGFTFDGTEAQLTGYLASAEIVEPEKYKPGFNLTPFGMYAIGPGPGRVSAMDFDGGVFDRNQDVTLDHLQGVLRRVSGMDITLSELRFASTFTDRAKQATTYRNGRVLLAGDAAHIHSPLGAQGLNIGLIDAMNLGWKLAATIKGTAPGALLDSYTIERLPAGAWALAWTRAQVATMRPDPWGNAIAHVIRDLINTRDGAAYFASKISGVWGRYDLPGNHPLIGLTSPEFTFTDGSQLGAQLQNGSALLLDLQGIGKWHEFEEGYEGRLTIVSAEAREDRGIAALFIRPDGIVAWALDNEATFDETALNEIVRTWLGEPHKGTQ